MTSLGERAAFRHALLGAALRVLMAEHNLSDEDASATALTGAEEAMELAARDLVNAVDDLPPMARPKGWGIGPGAETA